MAFPDQRDRRLIRRAEELAALAADLGDWVAEFAERRRAVERAALSDADVFELLQLRRRAGNLYSSTRVPVAAAVYGPSQVGKSLFLGRVLEPAQEGATPLGRDERQGEPAYYAGLSFIDDLNPQSGSNEATALVTRFTTKDRTDPRMLSGYPVLARGLTRAEWLCTLARGFRAECPPGDVVWDDAAFEKLAARCASGNVAATDRRWRADLLDAYAYMRHLDPIRFQADEAAVHGLLARYPLSDDGAVALASALFWGEWPELSGLFVRVAQFLQRIAAGGRPGLLTHWAGVRFLLDSQRSAVAESPGSRCFRRVDWSDMRLLDKDGWLVLDYQGSRGGGAEDLAVIQAALLELVVPILPHRLTPAWRRVIEEIDLLDIPGMRAGREGAAGGERTSARTLDEQLEIVKRGKVLYLFDRYIDELQIQTLLVLARGGNLEVRGQMKGYVQRWGKLRYGKDWPHRVRDDPPALFLGMTGIDEEFRNRSASPGKELYDNRLRQLTDTLGPLFHDFGGKGVPFSNVYPVRYPGTWDTVEAQRAALGAEKWSHARAAFLESPLVHKHVRAPEQRWDAAMDDHDGGLSLLGAAFRECTDAVAKQVELERALDDAEAALLRRARAWVVPLNAQHDRDRRVALARRVVDWLLGDSRKAYFRVHALGEALCLRDGDSWALADFVELRPPTAKLLTEPLADRFAAALTDALEEWASSLAPARWAEHVAAQSAGAPWLSIGEFAELARYLKDYLLTDAVFPALCARLLRIIELRLKDEAVRRHARRKYVRLTLDEFVMNPGPDASPLAPAAVDEAKLRPMGLMRAFVRRWANRLEACCAAGAPAGSAPAPGDDELRAILAEWDGAAVA